MSACSSSCRRTQSEPICGRYDSGLLNLKRKNTRTTNIHPWTRHGSIRKDVFSGTLTTHRFFINGSNPSVWWFWSGLKENKLLLTAVLLLTDCWGVLAENQKTCQTKCQKIICDVSWCCDGQQVRPTGEVLEGLVPNHVLYGWMICGTFILINPHSEVRSSVNVSVLLHRPSAGLKVQESKIFQSEPERWTHSQSSASGLVVSKTWKIKIFPFHGYKCSRVHDVCRTQSGPWVMWILTWIPFFTLHVSHVKASNPCKLSPPPPPPPPPHGWRGFNRTDQYGTAAFKKIHQVGTITRRAGTFWHCGGTVQIFSEKNVFDENI